MKPFRKKTSAFGVPWKARDTDWAWICLTEKMQGESIWSCWWVQPISKVVKLPSRGKNKKSLQPPPVIYSWELHPKVMKVNQEEQIFFHKKKCANKTNSQLTQLTYWFFSASEMDIFFRFQPVSADGPHPIRNHQGWTEAIQKSSDLVFSSGNTPTTDSLMVPLKRNPLVFL